MSTQLAGLTALIERYGMTDYVETFHEEHVWDTNWKILAENFMESYHLPMLHRATVGPHSKLEEMECPPGLPAFNYHWITKEASLPIGNAHPNQHAAEGHWRKYHRAAGDLPDASRHAHAGLLLVSVLQPQGVGRVHIRFGGGLAPEFIDDPQAAEYMATLKTLLDEVNAEDRRGVEAVFRGVHAPLAKAGPSESSGTAQLRLRTLSCTTHRRGMTAMHSTNSRHLADTPMPDQSFISFSGVSKSYDGTHYVVEGLDLDVAQAASSSRCSVRPVRARPPR